VTVNLAPANIRKDGTAFDLPIALAFLVATGQLDEEVARTVVAIGELGLDGTLRPVRGALSVARRVAQETTATLILPPANVAEASLVGRARLTAPATLRELVEEMAAGHLEPARASLPPIVSLPDRPDLADVVGQDTAKRAIE